MAERDLTPLATLLRQRSGSVAAGHDAAERERLLRAVTAARPARASRVRYLGAVAAAAIVALAVVAFFARSEARLEYAVEGGAQAEEGYVQALDEGATLSFSDGSVIELAPGSASRVVDLRADGARVLLERGRVDVHVVHRADVRWVVAAGPFAVAVTGTRFQLGWEPRDQRLDVRMIEGAVVVRGPMVEQGIELGASQALVANVARRELALSEGEVAAAEPAEAGTSPPAAPRPAEAASSSATPAPATTTVEPAAEPWSKLVAAGKYREVLDAANAQGIGGVLAGAGLDQLVALGDAARYGGDGALAQKAFMAVRERFPQSDAARAAAFMLGRMSEGSGTAAIGWYDRYLAEAPRGPYAGDALGRKLAILAKSDRGRAHPVAQQYLKAYPKGPYAALAREILRR